MKRLLYILIILMCLPAKAEKPYSRDLDKIFSRLDEVISRSDEYREQKENRIKELRERLEGRTS